MDLTDLEQRRPYVRDSDVVVLGVRDADEALHELASLEVPVWPVSQLRDDGPVAAVGAALGRLEEPDLDGFWVHVDADILDPQVMPAVDTPDPDGLSEDELVALLGPLAASSRCVGLEITIFDPDLDPDGALARRLTDTLLTALSPILR